MQSNETALHAPVRWGVLSAANIAVKHVAPAIVASSNGRLAAVGSRNPQRAEKVFTFAPDVIIYSDYEGLINDPEIEAIYNPLPNSLHAEWTIKALEAGKHVFCEKPLAASAREAPKMGEGGRANNVLVIGGILYCFPPSKWCGFEQNYVGGVVS